MYQSILKMWRISEKKSNISAEYILNNIISLKEKVAKW